MQDVVIVAATRTAVGSFQGSLAGIPAPELGAAVIRRLLEQTGLDAGQVDEVILGQVLTAGSGQNPARQAAIKAGLPVGVPAMTLNKVCGSGLKALHLGAQAIRCGDAEVIVAGGQENMSLAPYVMPGARTGLRMGHAKLVDSMIEDGLWDAFNDYHMGITAENLAEKYGLTREEQDAFAAASQQKAIAAIEGGRFRDEITPIQVPQRKGEPLSFDTDEQPRAGTTVEALAKLKPAFRKDGSVTAGNASSLNDGAAAVLLMSAAKAKALGLPVLARIASYASAGVDPAIMGIGPVSATRRALDKAGATGPDRGQRGLRRAVPGGGSGTGLGCRQGQRQRRRHRPWPPDRRVRLPGAGDPAARDDPSRREEGPRHPVHRRRAGRRPDPGPRLIHRPAARGVIAPCPFAGAWRARVQGTSGGRP